MGTRTVITFRDQDGDFSIYQHYDGYPDGDHGVKAKIENLFKSDKVWKLPRFEADEAAAGYIALYKTGEGNIRLTRGPDAHGDLEYTYLVTCANGKIKIKVKAV